MTDKRSRQFERQGAAGDPEAAQRAARELCRVEGHRNNTCTFPDPEDAARVVSVGFCFRCLLVTADLVILGHRPEMFTGPRGLVSATSTTGRVHVVDMVPPWTFPGPGKKVVSYLERYRYTYEGDSEPLRVSAICPANVEIPARNTSLKRAMELAAAPVTCQHCLKMIADYRPNDEAIPAGLSLANIVQTRTHYALRYGHFGQVGPYQEDLTHCIDCGHAIHLYFDCAVTGCGSEWACTTDSPSRHALDSSIARGALSFCEDCNISIPPNHMLCGTCVEERNNPYV